jgi:hypothetical protein
LYLNATKRDIKQIRPFAQSAHATIRDAITQPLAMFNKGSLFYSHCAPHMMPVTFEARRAHHDHAATVYFYLHLQDVGNRVTLMTHLETT